MPLNELPWIYIASTIIGYLLLISATFFIILAIIIALEYRSFLIIKTKYIYNLYKAHYIDKKYRQNTKYQNKYYYYINYAKKMAMRYKSDNISKKLLPIFAISSISMVISASILIYISHSEVGGPAPTSVDAGASDTPVTEQVPPPSALDAPARQGEHAHDERPTSPRGDEIGVSENLRSITEALRTQNGILQNISNNISNQMNTENNSQTSNITFTSFLSNFALVSIILIFVYLIYSRLILFLKQEGIENRQVNINIAIFSAVASAIIAVATVILSNALAGNISIGRLFELNVDRNYTIAGFEASKNEQRGYANTNERFYAIPIFFENGHDDIDSYQEDIIGKLADSINNCAQSALYPIEIEIIGYSSSAEYRSASETNNLTLANRRAAAVSEELRRRTSSSDILLFTRRWPNHNLMVRALRFNDRPTQAERLEAAEFLNRYAEIVVLNAGACAPGYLPEADAD